MHGQVNAAFDESFFNLLGEHALRPDLREGDFLQPVAGRLDDFDMRAVAVRAQKLRYVIRLPESELRSATADSQIHLPPTALVSLGRAEPGV